MGRLSRFLMLVVRSAAPAIASPVVAQDSRLRPRLSEARLWQGIPELAGAEKLTGVDPLESGIRLKARSSLWSEAFVAGYLMGALAGSELQERATPPPQLRLWADGWYDGVTISSDPSALGAGPPRPQAGPVSAFSSASHPALVNGLFDGLLDGLASGLWRLGR